MGNRPGWKSLRRIGATFLAALSAVAVMGVAFPPVARAQQPLLPAPPRFAYEPGTGESLFEFDLFFRMLGPAEEEWGAYAAYAQRSLWDLDNNDDPFRVETNFRPELGWLMAPSLGRRLLHGWPDGLSVAAAFVHESNGLEEQLSRGGNRAQGALVVELPQRELSVGLVVWKGFRVEPTNEDLRRYAGDGELLVQWRWSAPARGAPADARARLRTRFSTDSYHGRFFTSLEATALLHPTFLPRSILPGREGLSLDLLLQWFVGTGEMLHDFRAHQNRLRVGLALRAMAD